MPCGDVLGAGAARLRFGSAAGAVVSRRDRRKPGCIRRQARWRVGEENSCAGGIAPVADFFREVPRGNTHGAVRDSRACRRNGRFRNRGRLHRGRLGRRRLFLFFFGLLFFLFHLALSLFVLIVRFQSGLLSMVEPRRYPIRTRSSGADQTADCAKASSGPPSPSVPCHQAAIEETWAVTAHVFYGRIAATRGACPWASRLAARALRGIDRRPRYSICPGERPCASSTPSVQSAACWD